MKSGLINIDPCNGLSESPNLVFNTEIGGGITCLSLASTSSKILQCQLASDVIRKISCGLDFLTQLCAEKDPFLKVILSQAKYK